MFHESPTIHPLALFIKNERKWTWKEFATFLEQRVYEISKKKISLTPANVRNYSTGSSKTWWFWGLIGEIGLNMWLVARSEAVDINQKRDIDLQFAEMFSPDLLFVYDLLYAQLEIEDDCKNHNNAVRTVLRNSNVLANIFINQTEDFFNIKLPDVTL